MTRLVLGTAQFGDAYGVTNGVGRLSDDDVRDLLRAAVDGGVDTFDSAADYGDSQARLGALAPAGRRYVTKFSLGEGEPTAESLYERSRRTLGVDRLAGVMFHRLADLTDPRVERTVELLREARVAGVIERAGVSIYDADDLELALRVFPDLDLLQLPGNILDARLLDHPLLHERHEAGVEVHVRSAFLQGVLLSSVDQLPPFFSPLAGVLAEARRVADDQHSTVLGVALRYLRDHPVVDGVVVGATTTAELGEILAEWSNPVASSGALGAEVAPELIDPRKWPAR